VTDADAELEAWLHQYDAADAAVLAEMNAEAAASLAMVEAWQAAEERERPARLAKLYSDVSRATAHVSRETPP
jgi:hypothetical protein